MRIKDKAQFALGILNILLAIIGTIILIGEGKIGRIPALMICFACGVIGTLNSIEREGKF